MPDEMPDGRGTSEYDAFPTITEQMNRYMRDVVDLQKRWQREYDNETAKMEKLEGN
jgi:hypothetical protein